ncbi:hypothetical protein A6S26_17965 [Nostoc sp. ATCC 43529]|nr:hypothetical protein A6S26_17965 [Nostoc sp. ATCC 43529]
MSSFRLALNAPPLRHKLILKTEVGDQKFASVVKMVRSGQKILEIATFLSIRIETAMSGDR